jgi:putative ATPase
MDLFDSAAHAYQPLAARVRPQDLHAFIGQTHLLGPGRPLASALAQGALHSMVLWGPPGVGKTSFARLLANHFDALFRTLSAVLDGVKEIRAAVDEARMARQQGRWTLLFVDEVHRFNKSQQDAFLPFVEDGTLTFIGATTENPSFELNNALLSRVRVYVLKKLTVTELEQVLRQALTHPQGYPEQTIEIDEEHLRLLATVADGDARRALNLLELVVDLADAQGRMRRVRAQDVEEVIQTPLRRFDKGGDLFYEQISALHKSVRGSDPDAALYWLVRMLDGGCDPLYIARRTVRMASEDIGNADPRALQLTLNAWDVLERLGAPEGELALAQALVYLALAPKSNAVYSAFKQCRREVSGQPEHEVPMHLRNAPTKLMRELGMGEDYRYAHDEPDAFAAGESYFPEALHGTQYYHPVARGLEIRIGDKLRTLREANRQSARQRYE